MQRRTLEVLILRITIDRNHALASTGKIRNSAKLPCHYMKRPPDQINQELVANVFKKQCILDSMDGTEDYKCTKNPKITKTEDGEENDKNVGL